jgi:putative phosphotransacetylase
MNQVNEALIIKVVLEVSKRLQEYVWDRSVVVGVSNRHVHLSKEDLETLFGEGYELVKMKDLKQPGEFAAEETVTITGPKGSIYNVRILGPVRNKTQVEISMADGYTLGIKPPVRESGKIEGAPGIVITGPKGTIKKENGVIIALRHIHMPSEYARYLGVKDGDMVCVQTQGIRKLIFGNVLVRVSDRYALEMHIDIDEANSSGLRSGERVKVVTCEKSFQGNAS